MRKILAFTAAMLAVFPTHGAIAAEGIECVASDLTQDTMEGLGAAAVAQYGENPVDAETSQIEEFQTILAACATQWGWSKDATMAVSNYTMGYLGTRFAFNTLQSKKAFDIEPFYDFIGQMDEAEVQTALTTQIFGEQRKQAFIQLVVNAVGDSATQEDANLFHGFLMVQLIKNDAEKQLKTL